MKHFVWVDMEMTGLNVDINKILEISMIITDSELNVIEKYEPITIGHNLTEADFHFGGSKKTHKQLLVAFKKSGLLDRVAKSTTTEAEAEKIILKRLKKHCEKGNCHLAGSSIWRDAMFMEKYLPNAWSYLHYRLIDVSAFKTLREEWYPDVPEFPKKELHDATEDILESLEQLKYYRKYLFKKAS